MEELGFPRSFPGTQGPVSLIIRLLLTLNGGGLGNATAEKWGAVWSHNDSQRILALLVWTMPIDPGCVAWPSSQGWTQEFGCYLNDPQASCAVNCWSSLSTQRDINFSKSRREIFLLLSQISQAVLFNEMSTWAVQQMYLSISQTCCLVRKKRSNQLGF